MVKSVLGGIDTVSEWSGRVLGMLILVITAILMYEITMRYIFNAPTIWAHETCQHLFASFSMLAGAYVLLYRQHIKVDVIYARFSPRGRAIIDSITYLFFFLFCGLMLWHGIGIAAHSVKIMEVSFSPFAPPIWPLKLTIPIAAFLIVLQGVAHWVRVLSMAITGKELA